MGKKQQKRNKRNYSRAERKTYGTCVYCGQQAQCIDHVTPVSYGGSNDLDNLVPACNKCNGTASNLVFKTFDEKYRYVSAKRYPALRRFDVMLERLYLLDVVTEIGLDREHPFGSDPPEEPLGIYASERAEEQAPEAPEPDPEPDRRTDHRPQPRAQRTTERLEVTTQSLRAAKEKFTRLDLSPEFLAARWGSINQRKIEILTRKIEYLEEDYTLFFDILMLSIKNSESLPKIKCLQNQTLKTKFKLKEARYNLSKLKTYFK